MRMTSNSVKEKDTYFSDSDSWSGNEKFSTSLFPDAGRNL